MQHNLFDCFSLFLLLTHIVFTPVDRVRRSACGWLKSRSCSRRIFRHTPRATCAAAALAATFRISRSLSPPCLGTTRTGSGVLHARLAEIPSCSQRIFRLIPRATCAAASLAATFRISRSLSPPCLGTTRTGSGVLHARLAEIPSCSQRIFRLIPRATCAAASLAATFRISRSLPPPRFGTAHGPGPALRTSAAPAPAETRSANPRKSPIRTARTDGFELLSPLPGH